MSNSTIATKAGEIGRAAPLLAEQAGARVGLWQRWHLGALLAHFGLSIIFTWPLVLNFLPGSGTLVPGVMLEDRDQNLWNLWWVRWALLHGNNPFRTDMLWYPEHVSLYYHTLNVFNGFIATPLQQFFSLTTTYNIIVLFSFVMGGYGAFLLVRYVCGNRWAALIGSVVFDYSAFHIATMRSLLQLISLEWVPFFVLFLFMAVYQPGWRDRRQFVRWLWRWALPASVALFLVTLVDWYYTLFSLMLAGLLGAYICVRWLWDSRTMKMPVRETSWHGLLEPWARIGICIGLYVVLASPILIPTFSELRSTGYMLPTPDAALSNSADLLAFFQPVRGQELWGRFFANRRDWPFGNNRYEVYFTYVALFLAGVALFGVRALRPKLRDGQAEPAYVPRLPGKWFWAACVAIFFILALGPVLQVNGFQVRWLFTPDLTSYMPYTWIQGLPVFNISRSPDRYDMPLTLCLGILAGYGTNVLMNTWFRRMGVNVRGALFAAPFIALVIVELTPFPYPQRPAGIPIWYQQIGNDPADYSILDLPPQDDFWHGAYRMYFQTAHHKHIFGGYISREYPHPFLSSTPGYQELTSTDGKQDMFADGPNEWLTALQKYDTRYIVLQKNRLPDRVDPPQDITPSLNAIKAVLGQGVEPVYEDDQLQAYALPPPSKQVPYLSVGSGWEPRETGPNGTFRWMHATATLQIDAPRTEQAYLIFKAMGLVPRTLQIFHGDLKVFEGQVGGLQDYRVGPLGLSAGTTTLTFISPQGTTSPAQAGMGSDPRQLSFAILGARLDEVEK